MATVVRLLALAQADRVGTQLQVGAQCTLVLWTPGLVVDDGGHTVEARVHAVEAACDIRMVEADADRLLDAVDDGVRPSRRLDVASQLLIAVRAQRRVTALGTV